MGKNPLSYKTGGVSITVENTDGTINVFSNVKHPSAYIAKTLKNERVLNAWITTDAIPRPRTIVIAACSITCTSCARRPDRIISRTLKCTHITADTLSIMTTYGTHIQAYTCSDFCPSTVPTHITQPSNNLLKHKQ